MKCQNCGNEMETSEPCPKCGKWFVEKFPEAIDKKEIPVAKAKKGKK